MRYFLVLLILCRPGFAAEATIEERLAKLESEVRQLQTENRDLRAMLGLRASAPPTAEGDHDVKAAGPERRLQVGGILQVQGEAGDALDSRYTDNNARIFLRRARLTASGRFGEQFDFRTQIDMTGSIGAASALRAQLTDAYITWNPLRRFNLRAGQFKTPFGFEQFYPDPEIFTPERTLGSDRLTLGRQIGVSAFGALSDRVEYALGVFNGNGINTSANDNDRFLYAGRLSASLWKGTIGSKSAELSAGINGFSSNDTAIPMPDFQFPSNAFTGHRTGIGADGQGIVGPLQIWIEWLRDRFDPRSRTPFSSFDAHAASVLGIYTVEKIQFVARYDAYNPDTRSTPSLSTITWDGGVNYLIRGNDLKLQLHGVRARAGDGTHSRIIARLQTVF